MSGVVDILVVIGQLEIGGTERHLLNVLPAIQDDDIKCTVYTLRGGGSLERTMVVAGVKVISPSHQSRGWLGLLRTVWHLVATLRAERPDILHFFLPEAYLLGGFCSLVGPSCIRVMSRRSLNHYQRKWAIAPALEQFFHRRMDCVLSNSAAVAEDLRGEGVAESINGIIYNGVELPVENAASANAALRADLRIDDGALVLVMVANLIHYKGHSDVIEALHVVRDQMPDNWTMLMIGRDNSEIQKDLAEQAETAGLADHFRWIGPVADVNSYLSIADIAIAASHEEGFSNAVLESMAASLPLIVTDVGGNTEAVIDGESGVVVPAQDPEALGKAIVDLGHDDLRRAQLGQAARARVASHFTMNDCVNAYKRVYQSLARGSQEPIRDVISAGA